MRRGSLPTRRGGAFSPFFELKEGVLLQPRRVGSPMRRGACPTRRGEGGFTLFQAKREFPAAAMLRWSPNATSLTPNAT